MTPAKLYVHVLLDRSGSMEDIRDKTIDAFNEYVHSLKISGKSATRLSLTTFDSDSIDLVFDTLRVADVPKLTRETFVPRAMTPLYDAIGHTVAKIDRVTLLPDERVAVAILTDGLENASREFKKETVRKLLTDRQERCNWLVTYLGANQDAWTVGESIGVARAHAMTYAAEHVDDAILAASQSVERYRAAPAAKARKAAAYTDAERAAAKGDGNPPA